MRGHRRHARQRRPRPARPDPKQPDSPQYQPPGSLTTPGGRSRARLHLSVVAWSKGSSVVGYRRPLPANAPVIPHSLAPSVIPHSLAPSVIPHSLAPSVIPHSLAQSVIPHERSECWDLLATHSGRLRRRVIRSRRFPRDDRAPRPGQEMRSAKRFALLSQCSPDSLFPQGSPTSSSPSSRHGADGATHASIQPPVRPVP